MSSEEDREGGITTTTMKGKVCIVTGSNSGIGRETARGLARMGTTVVMVVRSRERGEAARTYVIETTGNSSIDMMLCDLSSMSSIRQFAGTFREKYDRLDALINNAGAVFPKRQVTVDGFERTLAVNYLAPFLLTHEMLPLLRASTPSRVINVSSGEQAYGKVDLSDLQTEKKYGSRKAYANAKLMVILFTYELARRLEGTGVAVNAVHPGFSATNLGKNTGSLVQYIAFGMMKPFQQSAEEGAETSIYLASSPEVEGITGKYFYRKRETTSSPSSYDVKMQGQLWDLTVKLLDLVG